MSTVVRLREVLGDYFGAAEARTALLRLREAALLPAGTHGRCGSAEITMQQAALCLFTLVADADPKDAPAEVQRIGRFRLLRRDTTHSSEPPRSVEYWNQQTNLLDAVTAQLARGPDPETPGWCIGKHEAAQLSWDRLVFGDGEPSSEVERQTVIGARLLADIGGLFREPRAEAA